MWVVKDVIPIVMIIQGDRGIKNDSIRENKKRACNSLQYILYKKKIYVLYK